MAEAAASAPAPPRIKTRKLRQRACDEKDAKGKVCCGHLKRWYDYGKDVEAVIGPGAEIYRCEYCHTIYLPAPGYAARTGTLQF